MNDSRDKLKVSKLAYEDKRAKAMELWLGLYNIQKHMDVHDRKADTSSPTASPSSNSPGLIRKSSVMTQKTLKGDLKSWAADKASLSVKLANLLTSLEADHVKLLEIEVLKNDVCYRCAHNSVLIGKIASTVGSAEFAIAGDNRARAHYNA
jgi:hypothetical protein